LLPFTGELLRQFGDRLRMARLRRRLSAKQVAERAGMAPMTLRSLERGGSGVTMGAYLAVMQVLGIERDLNLLAEADPVGRELQDARLPARKALATRPPERLRETPGRHAVSATDIQRPRKPNAGARDWIEKSGFASSDALAGLIDPVLTSSKKKR